MRHALFLPALVPLAACTSIEALRPDMHARPVPSRGDEIAMINGMRSAIQFDPTVTNCFKGEGLTAFRPKFVQGYGDYQEANDTYPGCPTFKSLTAAERKPRIREYLDSGFGLVDLYCNRFFMIAAETRQSRQIQRNTGSALDTLITTVMQAAGTGEQGVAILNHGFEAFDATYKNIDAAFLVAPDRDDLVALVTSAQDKIRTDSYATDYNTYAAARSAVERYASKCTFDGMKDLVGTAVRNAAKDAKGETKKPGGTGSGNGQSGGDNSPPPAETKEPASNADMLGSAVPG